MKYSRDLIFFSLEKRQVRASGRSRLPDDAELQESAAMTAQVRTSTPRRTRESWDRSSDREFGKVSRITRFIALTTRPWGVRASDASGVPPRHPRPRPRLKRDPEGASALQVGQPPVLTDRYGGLLPGDLGQGSRVVQVAGRQWALRGEETTLSRSLGSAEGPRMRRAARTTRGRSSRGFRSRRSRPRAA